MAKKVKRWIQKAIKKKGSLRNYFYKKYGSKAFDKEGKLKINIVLAEYERLKKKYEKKKDERILRIIRRIELYFKLIKFNPQLEKKEKEEILEKIEEKKEEIKEELKEETKENPNRERDIIETIAYYIYKLLK